MVKFVTKLSDDEVLALAKHLTYNPAMSNAELDIVGKIKEIARQVTDYRKDKAAN